MGFRSTRPLDEAAVRKRKRLYETGGAEPMERAAAYTSPWRISLVTLVLPRFLNSD